MLQSRTSPNRHTNFRMLCISLLMSLDPANRADPDCTTRNTDGEPHPEESLTVRNKQPFKRPMGCAGFVQRLPAKSTAIYGGKPQEKKLEQGFASVAGDDLARGIAHAHDLLPVGSVGRRSDRRTNRDGDLRASRQPSPIA
jgi:hypothetical protein